MNNLYCLYICMIGVVRPFLWELSRIVEWRAAVGFFWFCSTCQCSDTATCRSFLMAILRSLIDYFIMPANCANISERSLYFRLWRRRLLLVDNSLRYIEKSQNGPTPKKWLRWNGGCASDILAGRSFKGESWDIDGLRDTTHSESGLGRYCRLQALFVHAF